jgi:hypothetical protein
MAPLIMPNIYLRDVRQAAVSTTLPMCRRNFTENTRLIKMPSRLLDTLVISPITEMPNLFGTFAGSKYPKRALLAGFPGPADFSL